ncbi:hypothetical protein B7463_g7999, partial [Scytalidium lignicola]
MLCCKGWFPLAQAVLYRDVILTASTLPPFVRRRSSISADANGAVRVLTLRLDPAKLDQSTVSLLLKEFAIHHLKDMKKLISLSVYQIPSRSPRNDFAIPTNGLVHILENLSQSCTALELQSIKLSHRSPDQEDCVQDGLEDQVHMCPYLREVLPQLRYLRLRLSTLCPDLCGTGYQYDQNKPFIEVKDTYETIKLPYLKECVINLARKYGPMGGNYGAPNSVLCHDPARSQPCLPALASHMRHLVQKDNKENSTPSCPVLKKLWIVDFQPNPVEPTNQNNYAAFIRRDILNQTSLALPHRNFGMEKVTWHLRQPVPSTGSESHDWKREWEDFVGSPWAIEQLAEGPAWEDLESPLPELRLASQLIKSKSSRFTAAALPVLSKDEFRSKRTLSNVLWANEKIVGQMLMEPTQKGLLAQHNDLDMRIPEGWHFPSGGPWLERIE